MTHAAIEEMINQCVDIALEARQVNRDLKLGNGNDNGGGNGNGNSNKCGARNGNNGGDNGDGDENRNVNGRGDRMLLVNVLTRFQDMSTTEISGERMQHVTLIDDAYSINWWNSHKRTIVTDGAYALLWRELMKLMIEVYYPRNEIQKMETELWNLSMKNNDMATYTQRFQELTMMCTKMVPRGGRSGGEIIRGLPDNS
ncbi:putative reverse transcriptase domain-containing protein [Tanacetum coccineum]